MKNLRWEDDLTWRQLFELWRLDNPSDEESAQDVAAIQQSLDAMAAGRMRPFSEFDAEFRTRYGIAVLFCEGLGFARKSEAVYKHPDGFDLACVTMMKRLHIS